MGSDHTSEEQTHNTIFGEPSDIDHVTKIISAAELSLCSMFLISHKILNFLRSDPKDVARQLRNCVADIPLPTMQSSDNTPRRLGAVLDATTGAKKLIFKFSHETP